MPRQNSSSCQNITRRTAVDKRAKKNVAQAAQVRNFARKGSAANDVYLLLLDVLFFACLVIIFWKVSAAFTLPQSAEGIGSRQIATLTTYAASEHMLLYVDEAAKFGAYEALLDTFEKGGQMEQGAIRTESCGTYAGAELWTQGSQDCFPNTQPAQTTGVHATFEKAVDAKLRTITQPGYPSITDYIVDPKWRTATGPIVLRETTSSRVRLPIVLAKGTTQAAIFGVLQSSSAGTAQRYLFTPDTTLAKAVFTPNRKPRQEAASAIVIKNTRTALLSAAIAAYTTDTPRSVHYIIDTQGEIQQLVPEDEHALSMPDCTQKAPCALGSGKEKLVDTGSIEGATISIALVNEGIVPDSLCDGKDQRYVKLTKTVWAGAPQGTSTTPGTAQCWRRYPQAQLDALQKLLSDITSRHDIPAERIVFEEQVRGASESPGPALRGIQQSGAPAAAAAASGQLVNDQNAWWSTFRTSAVAAGKQLAAQAAAQPTTASPILGAGGSSGSDPGSPSAAPTNNDNLLPVQWPIDETIITSCYGVRDGYQDGQHISGVHTGLDIAAKETDDVHAVADGVIVRVNNCKTSCPRDGTGNSVTIRHTPTLYTQYMHMSKLDDNSREGATVPRGAVLGKAGTTGSSTGVHLHLTVATSDPGKPGATRVEPLCIFPEEILRDKEFGSSASNCRAIYGKTARPSQLVDVFAQKCAEQGVGSHTSAPSCILSNTPSGAPGSTQDLDITLRNIDEQKGLREAIAKAAVDEHLPPEWRPEQLMLAIIAQESRGKPDLISSTGCVGLGQFCFTSADKEIFGPGLKVCGCNVKGTSCTAAESTCSGDPRLDAQKNARALANLLKLKVNEFDKYQDKVRFGIAAYNAGGGVIKPAIKATGKPDPLWEDVAPQITEKVIYDAYCSDPSSTLCSYFNTPEEQRAKIQQIREYVRIVSGNYVAQGGNIISSTGDVTCGGVHLKEFGSYTFAPNVVIEVPNILTAFDRTVTFAKKTYETCDGDNNLVCLEQQKAAFTSDNADLSLRACDDPRSTLAASLAESITDCQDNGLVRCTCTWKPPAKLDFDTKNITITIIGNSEFSVLADGQPLVTEPSSLNNPSGTPGARYMRFPNSPLEQKKISYTFLYDNRQLQKKMISIEGETPYYLAADENPTMYKPDDDIAWTYDGKSAYACGAYKTTVRVCAGLATPIYSLSRKTAISPVIRFALDMKDVKPPRAVADLVIEQPEVQRIQVGVGGILSIADAIANVAKNVADESKLTFSFTPSPSKDISYYMVRCAKYGAPSFDTAFDFLYARASPTDAVSTQRVSFDYQSCWDGKTYTPVIGNRCVYATIQGKDTLIDAAGCYRVSVTPVDLSGNEGDTLIYDQSIFGVAPTPLSTIHAILASSAPRLKPTAPTSKPTTPTVPSTQPSTQPTIPTQPVQPTTPSQPQPGAPERILLLGDSLTVGYSVPALRLPKACSAMVLADAVVGRQTSEMLSRIQAVPAGKYTTVVVLGGVNDIASGKSATDVTTNLKAIADAARSKGMRPVFLTILPWKGYVAENYKSASDVGSSWTPTKQQYTDAANTWIRANQVYIDANSRVRDAQSDFQRLNPAYDDGMHLHMNNVGYTILASYVAQELPRIGVSCTLASVTTT